MNQIIRHPKILKREKTVLLIVDIQERIINAMTEKDRLIENNLKLIKGMKILNVPIYFTEQYPKGLSTTLPEIKNELDSTESIIKMSFSCAGAGDLFLQFKQRGLEQVVITGVESHVCVQQTVLDLLANNFQVDVAADAVSSRRTFDYQTALARMGKAGAEITSTESILFELLTVCGTDEFKSISRLVK
ncbi:MAG: hydrolase [bacterium]